MIGQYLEIARCFVHILLHTTAGASAVAEESSVSIATVTVELLNRLTRRYGSAPTDGFVAQENAATVTMRHIRAIASHDHYLSLMTWYVQCDNVTRVVSDHRRPTISVNAATPVTAMRTPATGSSKTKAVLSDADIFMYLAMHYCDTQYSTRVNYCLCVPKAAATAPGSFGSSFMTSATTSSIHDTTALQQLLQTMGSRASHFRYDGVLA